MEVALVVWVASAFIAAALAPRKGRVPFAVFLYGLLLGPIAVAWILLAEPVRFGD